MIRTKLGLLGLCAIVLGVMAMSASAAQATFSWLVLSTPGGGGTNLEIKTGDLLPAELVGEKDSEHLTLLTELVGLKIAITCTNFTLVNVKLLPAGKLSNGKVIFTGCAAYKESVLGENLGCVVKSAGAPAGTLETNEVLGELVLHTPAGGGSELLTRIHPVGENFATIRFEGCALTEVNNIRGVFYLLDCLNQAPTHVLRHLLVVEKSLTAIYLGAHSAKKLETTKIDGSAWVLLGGAHKGLHWAGMDTP